MAIVHNAKMVAASAQAVRWVWVSQVLIKTIDVRCGLCGQAEREELKLTPLLDDSHYLERIHQTSAAA